MDTRTNLIITGNTDQALTNMLGYFISFDNTQPKILIDYSKGIESNIKERKLDIENLHLLRSGFLCNSYSNKVIELISSIGEDFTIVINRVDCMTSGQLRTLFNILRMCNKAPTFIVSTTTVNTTPSFNIDEDVIRVLKDGFNTDIVLHATYENGKTLWNKPDGSIYNLSEDYYWLEYGIVKSESAE